MIWAAKPQSREAAARPPIEPSAELRRCLVLVGVQLLVLLAIAPLFDLSRFHAGGLQGYLNDQAGYVSVARNFCDSGTLAGRGILPSVLWQHYTKRYLYMPGYFVVLAAAYKVFGYSVLVSFLPSLLSFLISTLCVYWIGRQVYSARVGFIAGLAFIFLTPYLVFAYTAMMEDTFACVCLLYLALFVTVPERYRPFLGLLIIVPMLFRETAVLLVLLTGAISFDWRRRQTWGRVALLILLSGVGAFIALKIGEGRPSLMAANIVDGHDPTIYTDAVAQSALHPTMHDWIHGIRHKIWLNRHFFFHNYWYFDIVWVRLAVVWAVAMLVVGGWKRDRFAIGSGLVTLAIFALALSLYTVYNYRGVRVLMFCLPLLLLPTVHASQPLLKMDIPAAAVLLVFAAIGFFVLIPVEQEMRAVDAKDHEDEQVLAGLYIDNSRVLISPDGISINYWIDHYPLVWSFIPANLPTLDLILQEYDPGTLIIDVNSRLDREELKRRGFVYDRRTRTRYSRLEVYRRPPLTPDSPPSWRGQLGLASFRRRSD